MALARSLAGSLVKPLASAITGASGGADPYAANGFSPDYVADFSATSADFFRVAGSDSDFATAFTSDSEGGGLAVQNNSSGNLVWRAHNLITDSDDFVPASSDWASANGGTGTAITVTASVGTAPDGVSTAHRLQCDRGASDTTSDFSLLDRGNIAKPGGASQVAYGIWIKSNTGADQTLTIYDAFSGTNIDNPVATSEWQLFSYERTWSVGSRFILGTRGGSFGGDQSIDVLIAFARVYASNLGGVADNPDSWSAAQDPKYVPTTTAARYLARRRHHRWDGSAYVPTCLHEPVGPVTNSFPYSRDPSSWGGGTATLTKNATGIDGVSNSAYTFTDGNAGAIDSKRDDVTVANDTNTHVVSYFVAYDPSPATYPAIGPQLTGGTAINSRYTFDPSDGTLTLRSTDTAAAATYVVRHSEDYWRVSFATTNNGSNTVLRVAVYPAVNTDGSGTWVASTTGSHVFDQVDVVLNASLPSSPIPTNGSTVTRTADTLKGKAASLPYSSTAISMAVKGRYSRAASTNKDWLSWFQDASNRLSLRDSGGLYQVFAVTGATNNGGSTGQATTDGVAQPLNVAARFNADTNALQGASVGAAGAADTMSVAMPPLSDDDLIVYDRDGTQPVNGTVDTIRLWDEDIAEAGIEEATA